MLICEKCEFYDIPESDSPCKNYKYGSGKTDFYAPRTAPATNENKCMKCGAIIPEGRHICLSCEGTDDMQTFHTTDEQPEAVNHPAHYQGKHECIDEMLALFGVEAVKGFCMCNVYKYRFRAARKNGAEDIAKADWYMDKLMELNGVDFIGIPVTNEEDVRNATD